MATAYPISCFAASKESIVLPPDPYSAQPWSWAFVIFRHVADWPGYGLDTEGNLWSCCSLNGRGSFSDRWRKRVVNLDSHGYAFVDVRRFKRRHRWAIHRLVLEKFVGPCPQGMECCHNDGNPANNALSNLRWDTRSANQFDRRLHGTSNRGARNSHSKLTESQVSEIKRGLEGGSTRSALAGRYGVSYLTIYEISRGRTWVHVD